jgi:hypothetical protein
MCRPDDEPTAPGGSGPLKKETEMVDTATNEPAYKQLQAKRRAIHAKQTRARAARKREERAQVSEAVLNLKAMARSKRLIAQMGHVQIDSGPEPEPKREFPEHRKPLMRAAWEQLSPEDQKTLLPWRHENGI